MKVTFKFSSLQDNEILINQITDILHIQWNVQLLISNDNLSFSTFCLNKKTTSLKTCFMAVA